MIQICHIDIFRPIVVAARAGNLKPFGVIQGCLDTGDDERVAALEVLAALDVTKAELTSWTTRFHQDQHVYRQRFMEGSNHQ